MNIHLMIQHKIVTTLFGQFIIYKNVVLDLDYVPFTFQNPLPVFLHPDFRKEVGTAVLSLKGKVLYGNLTLMNTECYANLYPHLPFDVYGNINAIILSSFANINRGIKCLDESKT